MHINQHNQSKIDSFFDRNQINQTTITVVIKVELRFMFDSIIVKLLIWSI